MVDEQEGHRVGEHRVEMGNLAGSEGFGGDRVGIGLEGKRSLVGCFGEGMELVGCY